MAPSKLMVSLSLLAIGTVLGRCTANFKSQLGIFDFENDFEKRLLDKASAAKSNIRFASHASDDIPRPMGNNATKQACKAFPGNADWPSEDVWKKLRGSVED